MPLQPLSLSIASAPRAPVSVAMYRMHEVRERIVGVHQIVPVLDGRKLTYINFDNAASTRRGPYGTPSPS